jgi:CheY-like chemotaxis protein
MERKRISKLIHDELQQLLVAVRYQLEQVFQADRLDSAVEVVRRSGGILDEAVEITRDLSHELSPLIVYQQGLKGALMWLARRMGELHGLQVEVDWEGDRRIISETRRIFLFRSIQELLFNVVKHAGADRAQVQVRFPPDRIRIIVSDNGRGFDPKTVTPGNEKEQGGLGLHAIRERVSYLEGELDIHSAHGKGSRFVLNVPLNSAEPVPTQEELDFGRAHETGADRTYHAIRVLLSDDHQVVRKGLVSLLVKYPDIEVVGEASNGFEAVDLAGRLHPDVVLMDVSMPGMDGYEATRRIKKQKPEIRVIGLSVCDEDDIRKKLRQMGAEKCISKAAPSEELLDAIRGSFHPTSSSSTA